jgi:DNA-binding MarR family transcriptional regulator
MEPMNTLPQQLEIFSNYLQAQGQELFTQAFRNKGLSSLTILQLNYLELIERNPGLTPSTLAEHYSVSKPTVANIIKKLETAGLVRREKNTEDSRMYHIYATQDALDIFDTRRQMFTRLAAVIEIALEKSETENLVQIFGKIISSMDKNTS